MKWPALLSAALASLLPFAGQAAEPAASAVVCCPRVASAPRIDGRLEDPQWTSAPTVYLCGIRKEAPVTPVRARVLWTDEALLVGFDSDDLDVLSGTKGRDSSVWIEGDCFELFLAPPEGQPQRLEVQVNPAGALLDFGWSKDATEPQARSWNWDGALWKTHVRGDPDDDRKDAGWSAELLLPWAGLRRPAPRPGETWKVLFASVNRMRLTPERTLDEQTAWPFLTHGSFSNTATYGSMVFVDPPPDGPAEGVARVLKGHVRDNPSYWPSYRGHADYRSLQERDGSGELTWETQPAAEGKKPVTFVFIGKIKDGATGVPGTAAFELAVNGRPALRFAALWDGSEIVSPEGVRFSRRLCPPAAGPVEDIEHVYTLTLPRDLAEPGRAVRLSLRHAGAQRATFILMLWTDAALWSRHYPEGVHP